MARPRKDGSPTAQARLEAAFFDVLEATPFDRITVSAVVQTAGVNRNSFYYHFTDLDDLARRAVAHLLIPDVPRLLAGGFAPASEQIDEVLVRAATRTGSVRKLPIVLGSHGTAELRAMLRQALIDLWLDVFEITPDELDAHTAATMDFALGGMLELLSGLDPQADLLDALARMRRLPIVQVTSRAVMAALTEASRRAADRRAEAGGADQR